MLKKQLNKFFTHKVDALGLSIFRMFFAVILFSEIHQLHTFRHVIYDKIPFEKVGEFDVSFLFYFWFIVIVCLFLGLFTRITTLLNYIFSVIIFSSAVEFEYHVFYAYVGINFLLIFLPISRVFSIDSLLLKVKYTSIGKPFKIDRTVLQINYIVPVFVAIGLVYFGSIFHKFSSKMWMDGLGVWLPSSLPMIIWNNTSFLLNQKQIVIFLGYLVLVFETVFIFLFWFKKFRIPFLCLGMFFHIGILIAYPIPWFALTAVAVYLLMVPVSLWKKISHLLQFKKPLYTFYYDAECPLCIKVITIIKHFDVFKAINCLTVQGNYQNDNALVDFTEEELLINIHGVTNTGQVSVGFWAYVVLLKKMIYTYPIGLFMSLPLISKMGQTVYAYVAGNRLTERCTVENCAIPVYAQPIAETEDLLIKGFNQINITQFFWKALLLLIVFGQLLFIWFSPFVQDNFPKVEYANKIVKIPYKATKGFYVDYLGITHHPVFMFKNHFEGYRYLFKIEAINENGEKKLVPLLDDNGMVKNSYATGAFWVNYTIRVNSPDFNFSQYENGIIPYLKYYENVSKNNFKILSYILYVKEIHPEEIWENNFVMKQIAKPWIEAGTAKFEKGKLEFEWEADFEKKVLSKSN